MRAQKIKVRKIIKEYKEATNREIWEGVRDNFTFGFIGATLVVFIATKTDLAVLLGYLAYYFFVGKIVNRPKYVTDLGIPISVNNIMGFPTETRNLVFDTINLNRQFSSDGINAYSFVPFHGTPLRTMAENLGFVERGALARSIMAPTILRMPDFPRESIEGIRRCFVLYTKMPKSRWPEIERAEKLTPEGDKILKNLRLECFDKYMNYGDFSPEEEVEKVDFAKDQTGQEPLITPAQGNNKKKVIKIIDSMA